MAYTNNAYVTIDFDSPVTVEENEDVDCELMADVIGEPNETFGFYLDEELDVVAIDLDYNSAGVAVNNLYTSPQTATIEAGDITISKINITSDEVRPEKDDVIIAEFNVFAGQMIEWRDVGFDIFVDNLVTGTSTICDFMESAEFELWDEDTGSRYTLDSSACSASMISVSETDVSLMLGQGDKHFTLRASTTTNALAGNAFHVTFNRNDNTFYELTDDELITDVTPSTITWQQIEVVDSALDLTVLPMGIINAVIGYQGIETINFELEAADNSDIEVNDIVVRGSIVNASSTASARLVVGAPANFGTETYTMTVTCGSSTYTSTVGPMSTSSATSNENSVATSISTMGGGITASNTAINGYVDVTMPSSTCTIAVTSSTMNSNLAITNPNATVNGFISEDEISAVHLYRVESDGTLTLVDSESDINNDGTVDFNNISEMIGADDEIEYVVTADIVDDTNIAGTSFIFEIISVDADDEDNDSVGTTYLSGPLTTT